MLTLALESFRSALAAVSGLPDPVQSGDATYLDRVIAWLANTESELARIRRPEAAHLASLRSKLLSAREGYRDPQVAGELTSRRYLRAVAAVYLGEAESALRSALLMIEDQLRPLRGQFAQLVSAACLLGLLPPLAPGAPREPWLRQTLQSLTQADQTRGMAVFLRTSLAAVDRLYLLDEALLNLNEN